jgi:hypothetical protein
MVSGDFICCLLRTILLYAYTVKIFVYSSKLLFRHFLPTGSDIHRPNFWTFKEPKKRFQRTNSARLCSLAGRYDNPIPTRFLAPKDCLKILRSTVYPMTVNLHTVKAPPTERKEKFTPLWLCQWRKYILRAEGRISFAMPRKCSSLTQIRREQKMPGPLLLVYFLDNMQVKEWKLTY